MEPTSQSRPGDEWPPEVIEEVTCHRVAREAVRKLHPGLFASVSGAMFRHDPIGINYGDNTDEYDAEAGTVIPRLSNCASVDHVACVLREEFSRWFGADIAGRAQYVPLAKEVWRLWTESHADPGAATVGGA